MSALRDTALAYAAAGVPVLPLQTPDADSGCSCRRRDCSSPGKHPRTLRGLRDATTDEATIRKWWGQWPDANIGLRTGTPNGIVVLDFDSPEAERLLAALFGIQITELGGLVVETGRGLHRWYRVPEGAEIRSSAGRLGPTIDVKAIGGYVVPPPSLHPSGRRYRFVGGRFEEPPERLLAELLRPTPTTGAHSQVLTDRPTLSPLGPTTRYGRGVIERRCQSIRTAPVGERNYALLRASTTCAGYAATGEINLDDAREDLTMAALDAGLDERETARTIASGFERGLARPLDRPPSQRERLLAARSLAEFEAIAEETVGNG